MYLTILGELIDSDGLHPSEARLIDQIWEAFKKQLGRPDASIENFKSFCLSKFETSFPRRSERLLVLRGDPGRVFRDCYYRFLLLAELEKSKEKQWNECIANLKYNPDRLIFEVFIESNTSQTLFAGKAGLDPSDVNRIVKAVKTFSSKSRIGAEKRTRAFERLDINYSLSQDWKLKLQTIEVGGKKLLDPNTSIPISFSRRELKLLNLAGQIVRDPKCHDYSLNRIKDIVKTRDGSLAKRRLDQFTNSLGIKFEDSKQKALAAILEETDGSLVLEAKRNGKQKSKQTKSACSFESLGIELSRKPTLKVVLARFGIWDCDILSWADSEGLSKRHGIEVKKSQDNDDLQACASRLKSEDRNAYRVLTLPRESIEYLDLLSLSEDVAITNLFDGFNILYNPELANKVQKPLEKILPGEEELFDGYVPQFNPAKPQEFAAKLVLYFYLSGIKAVYYDNAHKTFWRNLCRFGAELLNSKVSSNGHYGRPFDLYDQIAIRRNEGPNKLSDMVLEDPRKVAICTGPTLAIGRSRQLELCFTYRNFYDTLDHTQQQEYFSGTTIHTSVNVVPPDKADAKEYREAYRRICAFAMDSVTEVIRKKCRIVEFSRKQSGGSSLPEKFASDAFDRSYIYKPPEEYMDFYYSENEYGSLAASRKTHFDALERSAAISTFERRRVLEAIVADEELFNETKNLEPFEREDFLFSRSRKHLVGLMRDKKRYEKAAKKIAVFNEDSKELSSKQRGELDLIILITAEMAKIRLYREACDILDETHIVLTGQSHSEIGLSKKDSVDPMKDKLELSDG